MEPLIWKLIPSEQQTVMTSYQNVRQVSYDPKHAAPCSMRSWVKSYRPGDPEIPPGFAWLHIMWTRLGEVCLVPDWRRG